MQAALLVDRAADPWAIAGQNRPKIGELRVGVVAFDQAGDAQPAVSLASGTSDIVILSAMPPNVTAPLLFILSRRWAAYSRTRDVPDLL